MKSISYYLTLFVIQLQGIKKEFSKNPINVGKIRKKDVFIPKGSLQSKIRNTTTVLKTSITELNSGNTPSDELLIFVHGGAFISGPAQHHWDTIKKMMQKTHLTIWMCNYPKAPEYKITEISDNIDKVYALACEKYGSHKITLIGDSVGGTLVTALVQRLIKSHQSLPKKIILVSPVMDASFTNKDIDRIDKKDPMLSKEGVVSAKRMCAENQNLNDERLSPLNGNFKNFPKTIIFMAEYDITYPDQLLAVEKMKQSGVEVTSIVGDKMPHIWPLLPVMKEAKKALNSIIEELNLSS